MNEDRRKIETKLVDECLVIMKIRELEERIRVLEGEIIVLESDLNYVRYGR